MIYLSSSPSSREVNLNKGFGKGLEISRNLMGSGSNRNHFYDSDGGNSRMPPSIRGYGAIALVIFLGRKGYIKPDHDHPYSKDGDPRKTEQLQLDHEDQIRKEANNPNREANEDARMLDEVRHGDNRLPAYDWEEHRRKEIEKQEKLKREQSQWKESREL